MIIWRRLSSGAILETTNHTSEMCKWHIICFVNIVNAQKWSELWKCVTKFGISVVFQCDLSAFGSCSLRRDYYHLVLLHKYVGHDKSLTHPDRLTHICVSLLSPHRLRKWHSEILIKAQKYPQNFLFENAISQVSAIGSRPWFKQGMWMSLT